MSLTLKELFAVTNELATESGEWCGAPMPIESFPLSIAKGYEFAKLDGFQFSEDQPETEKDTFADLGITVVNSWYCMRRGVTVFVLDVNGRRQSLIEYDAINRLAGGLKRHLAGFEVACVMDCEAELMAMEKLGQMVPSHLFTAYVLYGMLIETSKKSGVTYIFRKNRPTIAMRPGLDGQMRILACLCLHGLGYYEGTHLGVLAPTDDVISHLIMMRAKEHFYWRKANQHPAWAWQSGL